MKLKVREIKNKETWEGFLSECEDKTFLDSWSWGEFQKMMGSPVPGGSAEDGKIWRFGIYKNEELISVALVIKIEAKRGTFLFVPHGPVVRRETKNKKQKILKTLLYELKELGRREGASFIRVAPIWERNNENIKIFKDLGFRKAPIHIHPEITWELDITPPERELLMGMRKTTRYSIRQTEEKYDVEVEQKNNLDGVRIFNDLYQQTADRHDFVPFSFKYLKNEFLAFQPGNHIGVFLGRHKGEIIASAIIIFWQKRGFYHQGASIRKYSKIPISYRLQWEAILEAKRRGCEIYNFWGIAPEDSGKDHPWAGLTLFKKGFGGYKKKYVKTQDFVLSPRYWLTFIFEKIRKKKRGL